MKKKLGILTAGGDCPGLNVVLSSMSKRCHDNDIELIGFERGWLGLLENQYQSLLPDALEPSFVLGGTLLKSSKTFPLQSSKGVKIIKEVLFDHRLDGLVVVGGESSLSVCSTLQKKISFPFYGIPKTIDNDVKGTDYSIGFSSAVQTVSNYLDQLQTSAKSHDRLFIVEVMGRYTGWLAAFGGLAGNADLIYVPEQKITEQSVSQDVLKLKAKKDFGIIVVAEGVTIDHKKIRYQSLGKGKNSTLPSFGGIASQLKSKLDKVVSWNTKAQVIGHIQRGGQPNAFDRLLAISFVDAVFEGFLKNEKNKMAVHKQGSVRLVPLLKPHTPACALAPGWINKLPHV